MELQDEMTKEQRDDLLSWLSERPDNVRQFALIFPPGCTVKATRPLGIPAPGCIGQVVSYIEEKDGSVGCRVRGRWNATGPFMDAHCDGNDLELAEEGLVTRELIRELLDEIAAKREP